MLDWRTHLLGGYLRKWVVLGLLIGIVAEISLALALLNLLPILPLDGGHIVISIIERVRGRAFSQAAYMRYSAVGLSLFIFLLYLGLRNDFSAGHS